MSIRWAFSPPQCSHLSQVSSLANRLSKRSHMLWASTYPYMAQVVSPYAPQTTQLTTTLTQALYSTTNHNKSWHNGPQAPHVCSHSWSIAHSGAMLKLLRSLPMSKVIKLLQSHLVKWSKVTLVVLCKLCNLKEFIHIWYVVIRLVHIVSQWYLESA